MMLWNVLAYQGWIFPMGIYVTTNFIDRVCVFILREQLVGG